MDLVYIVREGDKNEDLRYSLRSIAKHYPDYKVWIVGYKPNWVKNVEYIPVKQTQDKWKNSVNNILTACKDDRISEDFILMNDDFFCIDPRIPIEQIADTHINTLTDAIQKHNRVLSRWCHAFSLADTLLKRMKVKQPYYSFEGHLPIKINRKKYLEFMDNPYVKVYLRSNNVLHKRTVYKNFDLPEKHYNLKEDVKIDSRKDNTLKKLQVCGWISVYDGQIKNPKFKDLNALLEKEFPNACKFEEDSH